MESARQSTQQRGLAETRYTFQQHMAARQHTGQDAIYYILLSDDNLPDFRSDRVQFCDRRGDGALRTHSHDSTG
jgi:hypothetical protein